MGKRLRQGITLIHAPRRGDGFSRLQARRGADARLPKSKAPGARGAAAAISSAPRPNRLLRLPIEHDKETLGLAIHPQLDAIVNGCV